MVCGRRSVSLATMLVVTKSLVVNLLHHPQTPPSTVPPTSVRACANHKHPPVEHPLVHRASVQCLPERSPAKLPSVFLAPGKEGGGRGIQVALGGFSARLTLSTPGRILRL
ncbi:hypothetical protein B0F90DRAFT_1726228 [Multifurca ochricompacta]|uniref:Secreted protein n=1 Tax=Multifurca ochricompacta TaxID=376703 RepID=A0AAD4QN56_9AGAM|nr:hypothetical protein B0F90DRAFT_1726228 [Multifurca ochricompacta]